MPTQDQVRSQEAAKTHLAKKIPFETLTQAQQRTVIALDALAQIDMGLFVAQAGKYWTVNTEQHETRDPMALSRENGGCTVCALGACFVASFGRAKEAKTPIQMSSSWEGRSRGFGTAIIEHLGTYFSPLQLGLMEAAFEIRRHAVGRDGSDGRDEEANQLFHTTSGLASRDHRAALTAAMAFGTKFTTDAECLRAILENVVENCGEFKP